MQLVHPLTSSRAHELVAASMPAKVVQLLNYHQYSHLAL